MDKISIIIPVFNVEPYIRKCLDSVVNQTYANLEILLINDGSTDGSEKICDEYAEKDRRIKVFHKENGGVSSAKNVGLKNFTGDYLGFVDSDDWIEPDMYEALYKSLTDNNVHLSAANFTRDAANVSVIETEAGREKIPSKILTQKEMLLYVFRIKHYAGFYCGLWNKLFKADVIRNSKLIFDENLIISEDIKFIADLIMIDKLTGIFVNKPLYHYQQRQGSLIRSGKIINELNRLNSYKTIIETADRKGFGDVAVWLKREHCYRASLLAEDAMANNDYELLALLQGEMNVYIKEYIETNSEYPERIERINELLLRKTK
ncbi:MAG: glycosyltransferase [Fibromonadaceae bacterium]|nr:glycosyltransferase [Fibromonadaceae bacterium]